jgi:very-short-patch-repair endonuclease
MSKETGQKLLEANFLSGIQKLLQNDGAFNAYADVQSVLGNWADPNNVLLNNTVHLLAAISAKNWIQQCWENRKTQSPIEELFFLAFYAYAATHTDDEVIQARCMNGKHYEPAAYAPSQVSICQQHSIGKFHVDFLITGYEYQFKSEGVCRVGSVIVECDGHEFHERTKEQAQRDRSRDRELQRHGYKVFRFTGSELFKDPFACAKEAFDAAFQK